MSRRDGDWEAVIRALDRLRATDHPPARPPLTRSALANLIGWSLLALGALIGLAIVCAPGAEPVHVDAPRSTLHAASATVVFYCGCRRCCGRWSRYGLTASGRRPVEGRTVAGPRRLPFGTRVFLDGVGWRTIEDRTARRWDGRFEVYVRSHARARRMGIRRAKVWVSR